MRVSSDMPDDVLVLHDALQQIRDIFGTPAEWHFSPSLVRVKSSARSDAQWSSVEQSGVGLFKYASIATVSSALKAFIRLSISSQLTA